MFDEKEVGIILAIRGGLLTCPNWIVNLGDIIVFIYPMLV